MDVIRILQVEDDPDDALMLSVILNERNARRFAVETAASLRSALERLSRDGIDVVLLDLGLPDSTGMGTLQRVRAAAPAVPLVVLTGTDDEGTAIEAARLGAQDYLVKGQIDGRLLERSLRYAMQRKRIEQTLADEQRRQRVMMDHIPDCRMYFKDREGRFLQVNPALARLTNGREPLDIVGKTDFDLYAPEHARNAYQDEQQVISTGEPIVGKVEQERLPDGSVTWALTTKMPLRNDEGEIVGTFGVSRDITALKETEGRLRETNQQLEKALRDLVASHEELKATQLQLIQAEKLRSLGQMAASVAHEVKNPLAILHLGIECLQEYFEGGEQEMSMVVREMRDAVHRAETVIRGMLDYSSERELALKEVDINELIGQTLRFVRHELAKAHVRTALELCPALPRCCVDALKLEQVLVNLFVNACHAMSDGGVLTVRSYEQECGREHLSEEREPEYFRPGDRLIILEVQDSGCGIPEEKIANVFEPFFTTKDVQAGTGLGLFVVKKIMDLHGAKIRFANAPEGGVRVTLMIHALEAR